MKPSEKHFQEAKTAAIWFSVLLMLGSICGGWAAVVGLSDGIIAALLAAAALGACLERLMACAESLIEGNKSSKYEA